RCRMCRRLSPALTIHERLDETYNYIYIGDTMRAHANISSMHNAGAGLLRWGAEALAAIALLALVGSAHAAPIKLGFINSLTGPGALVGEAAQAGVEFAVKEINEQGGIAGRPLELIVADDQTNP